MDHSLPADLAKLQSRFEHWRSTRTTRAPIPEDLLQAARTLLDRYSTSMVCRACRLHPDSLRKPTSVTSRATAPVEAALTPPAFYPLPPAPATNSDCRLVVERPDGARLTLTVPQLDADSLSSLCSDFLRS